MAQIRKETALVSGPRGGKSVLLKGKMRLGPKKRRRESLP